MIKRVPILPNINKSEYNNNNLHEYAPYVIKDNKLVIDKSWYESLTQYTQDLIKARTKVFSLEHISIPHEYQKDTPEKLLAKVYQSYIDGFDYHVWYSNEIPDGPKDVQMIHIPDVTKKALSRAYKSNQPISDKNIIALLDKIENHMQPNEQYFVRLSGTSGKNEKSVEPFDNARMIIRHLVSVKLFVEQEYNQDKETYLILIPWNETIDSRCELRIFVVDNQLTAASTQKWWELQQYSEEELDAIEYALMNIGFIGYIPYTTFVADVYIDVNTKTCHLIELNPFGAASGAGSSLFNWEKDYDLLYGINHDKNKEIELRYLSIIEY